MRRRSLQIGGRLDLYVSRLYLTSYATALFVVVGLFFVLDFTQNIDDYLEPMKDGTPKSTGMILQFYLLNLPFLYLQVAPFVTLVASLFTVSKLLKHNEVVAALGAGVSAQRLLAPIVVLALLAGAGAFQLRETLAGSVVDKRDMLRFVLEEREHDPSYKHLFLKDLSGSVVHLEEFRPATGWPPRAEIKDLHATLLSVAQWVQVEADGAAYVRRAGVDGWELDNGARVEVSGRTPVEMLEGFDFTPALAMTFARAHQSPLEVSHAEAREMARRDPDNVVYQTLLQYHVTFPLANLVLVLVGMPLLMRHDRRRVAASLGAACMLCILFFAADLVFRNLGLQDSLDPRFAVWMPVLLFGSLGIVLFDSMRT
jgi:lipopolysaccharide export LptBFGC system permease protein LptF